MAIGDLHGDLDNALRTLQMVDLVDGSGSWTGGSATLVQTGDVTDRGPDSRALIDLLRRLSEQARHAGGQVIPLLGNHEVMNLHGDWRYVDPGDIAAYGGTQARIEALRPGGADGDWLRTLDSARLVRRTVLVHGGVTPEAATRGLDHLNDAVRTALVSDPTAAVLGESGPLWYRGYVEDPESVACPRLQRALQLLEADRMVVGHTTQRDGQMRTRCEGALVVIDIGIADAYGGHLGAWELVGDDGRAVYPTGPVDLEDPVEDPR